MSAPRYVPTTHRRAARSSTTGNEGRFPHTTESEADLERLRVRWGLSTASTCRKALALAAADAGELESERTTMKAKVKS